MSWPTVKIKEVASVTTGKTPSKQNEQYFNGSIPFITPSELGDAHHVLPYRQSLTNLGAEQIKLVPKNSVLVCCIGSLGKLAIADKELATNQQINSVTFNTSKVEPKFGYYALARLKPLLEAIAPATTVAIVNKSRFEALEIPLPPLAEQQRIAAILDKADAIRQKRQQAIKLADDFLRSVFLEMFGDPVINPKGWELKKFKDVLSEIDSGKSPKCEARRAANGEWAVLKLSAVTTGVYVENENKAFLGDENLINKYEVKKGDLLFTRKNTKELVAAVAYVYDAKPKISMPDLIFRLNIKDSNVVEKLFIWGLLSNLSMRSQVQSLAGGAAGSMPNISKAKLLEVCVPVPPIELQQQYSSVLLKLNKFKENLMNQISTGEQLFNSLSQRAFSGEL